MGRTSRSIASAALVGAVVALLAASSFSVPGIPGVAPESGRVAHAGPASALASSTVPVLPAVLPSAVGTVGWPGSVVRTLLPNYNGSLPGNFRASVTALEVGTPAYVPGTGTFWWPELPSGGSTTPTPPMGPTLLYDAASHSVTGITTGIANASAVTFDSSHNRLYAAEPLDGAVVAVNASTGAAEPPAIPVGLAPVALGLDPVHHELFVANSGSDSVSVVNTSNGHVVATVPVGSDPVAVAVDPSDGWVFVANANSSNISVISTAAPSTPEFPVSLAHGPAVALAYANGVVAAVSPSSGYLTILNASTPTPSVLTSLVSVGTGATTVVATSNGSEFAVGRAAAAVLRLVNTTIPFNVSSGTISTPADPTVLAEDPASGDLLVFASGPRTIARVNLTNGTIVAEVPTLAPAPAVLALDAAADRLYVGDSALPGLEVLDPVSGVALAPPVELPSAPTALAFDAASGRVYVALTDRVEALDGSTGEVVAEVALPGANGPIVIDPASGLLWVGRPSSSDLAGLSLSSLAVEGTTGTIGVDPALPSSVTFDPALGRVYVLNASDANSVRPFNGSTGAFAGPDIWAGPNVTSIVYDPLDGLVYAAGDSLSAFDPATLTFPVSSVSLGTHLRVSSLAFSPSEGRLLARTVDSLGGAVLAVVDGTSAAAANTSLLLVPLGLGNGSAVPEVPAAGSLPGSERVFVANAGSGTVAVVGEPPSVATFAFVPASVEVNGTAEALVAATGGAGPVTFAYAGLPPGCLSASTPELVCVPTSVGSFEVALTVRDGYGATALASASLSVDLPVSVRASVGSPSVTSSDVGVPLPFSADASGGTGAYTYTWTFGDGASATGDSVEHAYTVAGVFAPSVTAVDSSGSGGLAVLALSILPAPSVTLPHELATDVGRPVNLTPVISGGTGPGTGSWTFDDLSTASGLSASHAWSRPGVYNATFSYVDGAGVEAGAVTVVTVHPPLTAAFHASAGDAPVPPATVVEFAAVPSGGTPDYAVTWSFGDGSWASGTDVSHAYARTGNFTVEVTLTDAAGSVVTSTLTVAVEAASPVTASWVNAGTAPGLLIGAVLGATVAAVALFFAERAKHHRPLKPPTPYDAPPEPPRRP